MGDVLRRLLSDLGPAPRKRRSALQEAWERAVGPALAAEARPSTLRGGVLTVDVRSAALLQELGGFRQEELLARLLEQEPSGRVRGLRFRLGVF